MRRALLVLLAIVVVVSCWSRSYAGQNPGGVILTPLPATPTPLTTPSPILFGEFSNCSDGYQCQTSVRPAVLASTVPTNQPQPASASLVGYWQSIVPASYVGAYMYFGESMVQGGYNDGTTSGGSFQWNNPGSNEYQAFNQTDYLGNYAPAMPLVTMGAAGDAAGSGSNCQAGASGGPTNDSPIVSTGGTQQTNPVTSTGTYDAQIDATSLQRLHAYTYWHNSSLVNLTKYPYAGVTIVRLMWEQNNGTQGNLLACDFVSAFQHYVYRARYIDGDTHTIFGYSPSGAGTCSTNIALNAGFTGTTPACFYIPNYEDPGIDQTGRPYADWYGWDNYDRGALVTSLSGCPSGTPTAILTGGGVCDLWNLQNQQYQAYVTAQGVTTSQYTNTKLVRRPVAWFETGGDCAITPSTQDQYINGNTQTHYFRNFFQDLVFIDYFDANKSAGHWAYGGMAGDPCNGASSGTPSLLLNIPVFTTTPYS